MTKYVKKAATPRCDEGWLAPPLLPDITVFEPESKMRPTGLYFPDGNEVMAIDRDKIGFVRFE